jgi:uncharacterized protein (DUF362 family)/ferredoxin
MRIAIKANLVSMMKPQAAATTHPALLCELVRMLCERGATPIIGDSPGGLYNAAFLNRIYSVTGMKLAEAAGAELNQDYSTRSASFEDAAVAHEFMYTAYLDNCDAIINFCKLKTHGMMGMSAAAKNMFGVVPGTTKPEYHYRFPDPDMFADMLVDLNEYFKPRLCLVVAVIGMEGNGPTAGTPRAIGALAASANPHALDLLCANIIGIDPKTVPTLQAAVRRGLVPADVAQLNITGEWHDLCIPDFHLVRGKSIQFMSHSKSGWGRLEAAFLRKVLSAEPRLRSEECVGCGECFRICPAKAITMENRRPVIDRSKCIKCFCCQEFCPKGAMKVHRTWIARMLEAKKKQ